MMAAALPFRSLFRCLSLATAVLLLLGSVACDDENEEEKETREAVEESYDIDPNDATQVGGAIAGGETLGNKKASDGVTVLSASQREKHRQRGDELARQGDDEGAIREYQEALEWNKPPPPKEEEGLLGKLGGVFGSVAGDGDPAAGADLQGRLARSHARQGNQEAAKAARMNAARGFQRAANATPFFFAPDARRKARYEHLSGLEYERAGARSLGCEAFLRAENLYESAETIPGNSGYALPSWCRDYQ